MAEAYCKCGHKSIQHSLADMTAHCLIQGCDCEAYEYEVYVADKVISKAEGKESK